MGFAVKADQGAGSPTEGPRKQNLVLLHPHKSSSSVREPFSGKPVQAVPSRSPEGQPAEIRQLPKSPRLPLGLKLLMGVQQGSTVVTGGLVATALVIYSWTVYLDKTLAHSFQHLEALKVSTQQMTTANETLKHSMAKQAESPAAGFKPFDPERVIFVPPAQLRPSVAPAQAPEQQSSMPYPLGY
ncbi:MAG: hypothetical protein AAF579_18490 [Cyanobacteria bacterium P01_C01_bin.118]